MATVPTGNYGVYQNSGRRSYITTSAYNADFYSYTTSISPSTFVTTGSLGSVAGADANSCKAGRVLRENGKKLYPDANPGVSTMMVGVFDSVSLLNGFIDPNSPKFAGYNTDKPYYLANGVNPNGGAADKGAPVYTAGTITADGLVTAGAGLALTGSTTLTTVALGTVSSDPATDFTTTTGTYYTMTLGGSFTMTATVPPAGTVVVLTVNGNATLTFSGTYFIRSATVAPGGAGNFITVGFVSNGTKLVEIFRSATSA